MGGIRLTVPDRVSASVWLPSSKSIGNRLLLLRALSGGEGEIARIPDCDDSLALRRGLVESACAVNVGAAGTAMRFLTAYCASNPGRIVTIDGSERMRERPIGVLVDALRRLGADITYGGREGFPPLRIVGKSLSGTDLVLPGDVSSQYVSALMMILPTIGGGTLHLSGEIISRPYIDMTRQLMEQMGVRCSFEGNTVTAPAGKYVWHDCAVEGDWSAASYWFAMAALMPDSDIVLKGLNEESLQGDNLVRNLFRALGVKARFEDNGLHLTNTPVCQCPYFADLADTPDLAQTIVVVCCLQGRPFRITGLRSLRIKETDRLEALRSELAKLGYAITIEGNDALSWNRQRVEPMQEPRIATYHDHRMAMAFAPAAICHPGLVIEDPEVVCKSYPEFWEHLQAAGFVCQPV